MSVSLKKVDITYVPWNGQVPVMSFNCAGLSFPVLSQIGQVVEDMEASGRYKIYYGKDHSATIEVYRFMG